MEATAGRCVCGVLDFVGPPRLTTGFRCAYDSHMKVVFGKMKDRGYPQDITEAEADMKFQRLLVQGIGNWKDGRMLSKSVPVVARILGPTDVIIKVFDLTATECVLP